VEFSRRFRSTAIGPVGGNCSISAIHFMANRVSPTSKMILSLITSSAEGSFGNSRMRCSGAGFHSSLRYHLACHRDHRLFIGGFCAHPALWT
jgi:hypothetical protein